MNSEVPDKEASFVDYLQILLARRKVVIRNCLVVAIVSAVVSLLLPEWYQGRALVMPPAPAALPGFSTAMAQLPVSLAGLGLGAGNDDLNLYLAILKSRTLAENVVRKFGLMDRYDAATMEEAIEAFRSNVFFELQDEGTISITVLDRDRDRVQQITNFIVDELDRTNRRLANQRAGHNRVFVEKRLADTEQQLREAENRLQAFQEQHAIIDVETQAEEAIRAAARIKASLMMLEVRIGVLEKSVSPTHPDLLKARTERAALQKEYDAMNFGGTEPDSGNVFPPFARLPEFGIEYLRLFRDVEVQNEILKFLMEQHEQAKIQEAKDTPTVQILDKAVRPERKARPRRALIVLSSTFVSFFLTWLWIIVREGNERRRAASA